MTTITDELAAALREAMKSLPIGWMGSFGSTWNETLAKYEAAKTQERLMPDFAKENQYEFECDVCHKHALGHKGRCVCDSCKAQKPHAEKGFPVVKVPGHVVNHMEWKDHALIVTVGPRHEQEPSDLVKRLRKRDAPWLRARSKKIGEPISLGEIAADVEEAADRIEALESEKLS